MTEPFDPMAMQEMMEPLRQMLDVIIGEINNHRSNLIAHGYNETAAEVMATAYHGYLMTLMANSIKPRSSDS